jgi:DivIVA domain-containing protein
MRVTPLDIIQKQFGPARRGGYDSDEVRAFLDEVRDALEESLKDNQRLREQLQRRESEIVELRSGEGDIKDTLLLARRLSEDMERSACSPAPATRAATPRPPTSPSAKRWPMATRRSSRRAAATARAASSLAG